MLHERMRSHLHVETFDDVSKFQSRATWDSCSANGNYSKGRINDFCLGRKQLRAISRRQRELAKSKLRSTPLVSWDASPECRIVVINFLERFCEHFRQEHSRGFGIARMFSLCLLHYTLGLAFPTFTQIERLVLMKPCKLFQQTILETRWFFSNSLRLQAVFLLSKRDPHLDRMTTFHGVQRKRASCFFSVSVVVGYQIWNIFDKSSCFAGGSRDERSVWLLRSFFSI